MGNIDCCTARDRDVEAVIMSARKSARGSAMTPRCRPGKPQKTPRSARVLSARLADIAEVAPELASNLAGKTAEISSGLSGTCIINVIIPEDSDAISHGTSPTTAGSATSPSARGSTKGSCSEFESLFTSSAASDEKVNTEVDEVASPMRPATPDSQDPPEVVQSSEEQPLYFYIDTPRCGSFQSELQLVVKTPRDGKLEKEYDAQLPSNLFYIGEAIGPELERELSLAVRQHSIESWSDFHPMCLTGVDRGQCDALNGYNPEIVVTESEAVTG